MRDIELPRCPARQQQTAPALVAGGFLFASASRLQSAEAGPRRVRGCAVAEAGGGMAGPSPCRGLGQEVGHG